MRTFSSALVLLFLSSACCAQGIHVNKGGQVVAGPVAPAQAAAAGHSSLVYDSEFYTAADVDLADSRIQGYHWYIGQPFDGVKGHTNPQDFQITPSGLTITPSANQNAAIYTATVSKVSPTGWVGSTFSGGFYIEFSVQFDNLATKSVQGWPSVWSFPLEHILGSTSVSAGGNFSADQWIGQANGYKHFIEDDFFEYDVSFTGSYGQATHDWYGLYNVTCGGFCSVNHNSTVNPGAVTWTNSNIIGQLYTPDTGSGGSTVDYFNNAIQAGGGVTWTANPPGTPPPTGTFQYSIIDAENLVVIIGSGIRQPLTINWVRIWQ